MHELLPITNDVAKAAQIIESGRLVAFPTGTSYGLAADALQGHALQRLRNVKARPNDKSFTVAVKASLRDTFFEISDAERAFLEAHKNSALTLLLKPKESLKHLVQDGRVGLRVVDHPVFQMFVDALEVPITATSANVSGRPACYDTVCVKEYFPGLLDPNDTRHGDIASAGHTTYDLSVGCVLDGGTLEPGRESTIVRLDNGVPIIIRQGSLTL